MVPRGRTGDSPGANFGIGGGGVTEGSGSAGPQSRNMPGWAPCDAAAGAAIDAAGTAATLVLTTAIPVRSGLAAATINTIFRARCRANCMATSYTAGADWRSRERATGGGHAPAYTGASWLYPAARLTMHVHG
jgi:hypothetical protein